MAIFKRHALIFLTGAVGYSLLELLWRGRTHPSMALLGGLCLLTIFFINGRFSHKSRPYRAFLCAAAITAAELLSGILLNLILHLSVWDYSRQPLHILGQICPLYSFLWFLLSLAVLYVLDRFQHKTHAGI